MRAVVSTLISALLLVMSSASALPRPVHAASECDSNYDDPDGELAAIAKRVPAFGGFYVDGSSLNVWLTDDGESLEEAVQEILSIYGYHDLADLTPTALPAKYSFMQLFCWHNGPMLEVWTDGVIFTDIDDMRNRLTVAVEDLATQGPAVRARLVEAGIPLEAVDVIEEEPIMLLPAPVDPNPPLPSPPNSSSVVGIGLVFVGIASVAFEAWRERRRILEKRSAP